MYLPPALMCLPTDTFPAKNPFHSSLVSPIPNNINVEPHNYPIGYTIRIKSPSLIWRDATPNFFCVFSVVHGAYL